MTAPSDREMFGGILASQLSTVAYRLRSLADQFDRFAADVPTTDAPSDVRASDIAARAARSHRRPVRADRVPPQEDLM